MQVEAQLSRREREKLARRQEMLAAARVVFAEKGYGSATIDEIAQRAQFGKGTLYNYFEGGKEDILRAILDQMYDDLVQLTERSFAPASLATTHLRDLFRTYLVDVFSYYHDNRETFLIVLKEAYRLIHADGDPMSGYFARQRNALVGSLLPALQYGMDSGQLRQLPVEALSQLILGNIKGCQLHACLAIRNGEEGCGGSVEPEAQADLLTTILFDGILVSQPEDSATIALSNLKSHE